MGRMAGTVSQRQLRHREVGWGGSRRQTSEMTNRHRIQGHCGGVTRRRMGKPKSQPDATRVNPAAIEVRSIALPWEISSPLQPIGDGSWWVERSQQKPW